MLCLTGTGLGVVASYDHHNDRQPSVNSMIAGGVFVQAASVNLPTLLPLTALLTPRDGR